MAPHTIGFLSLCNPTLTQEQELEEGFIVVSLSAALSLKQHQQRHRRFSDFLLIKRRFGAPNMFLAYV
jgi:hypothetical protein